MSTASRADRFLLPVIVSISLDKRRSPFITCHLTKLFHSDNPVPPGRQLHHSGVAAGEPAATMRVLAVAGSTGFFVLFPAG
ncbi:MAG: hypothetical protein ACK5PS_18585 [Desulfopila sp.]